MKVISASFPNPNIRAATATVTDSPTAARTLSDSCQVWRADSVPADTSLNPRVIEFFDTLGEPFAAASLLPVVAARVPTIAKAENLRVTLIRGGTTLNVATDKFVAAGSPTTSAFQVGPTPVAFPAIIAQSRVLGSSLPAQTAIRMGYAQAPFLMKKGNMLYLVYPAIHIVLGQTSYSIGQHALADGIVQTSDITALASAVPTSVGDAGWYDVESFLGASVPALAADGKTAFTFSPPISAGAEEPTYTAFVASTTVHGSASLPAQLASAADLLPTTYAPFPSAALGAGGTLGTAVSAWLALPADPRQPATIPARTFATRVTLGPEFASAVVSAPQLVIGVPDPAVLARLQASSRGRRRRRQQCC